MSVSGTKAAIQTALQTPKGHAQVNVTEMKAIEQAALQEAGGKTALSAGESEVLGKLLAQDTFAGTSFTMSGAARAELERFAATYHLPIGHNADTLRTQLEGVLAAQPQPALASAPSTAGLVPFTLSDMSKSDGAKREALVDATKGTFYLRTTLVGRGHPAPGVSYSGPFSLGAATPTPAPAPGRDLANSALLAKLTTDTAGLLYLSESDRPFDTFFAAGKGATVPTPAEFARIVGAPAGTHAEVRSLDNWIHHIVQYSQVGQPGDEARFTTLRDDLKGSLTDVKVYRLGERAVDTYLVGRNAFGDLVGVHTVAVET
jgi:hypothetical protein